MTLLWLRLAVLLYGVAALAVLPAALYNRPRWSLAAVPAAITAALFHFVSLAETLNAAHHRLPVETHEVQSFFALILAFTFLIVYARYRSVSIGIFVLPIAFMLAMLAAFRPGEETFSAPSAPAGSSCISFCCWPPMRRYLSLCWPRSSI